METAQKVVVNSDLGTFLPVTDVLSGWLYVTMERSFLDASKLLNKFKAMGAALRTVVV